MALVTGTGKLREVRVEVMRVVRAKCSTFLLHRARHQSSVLGTAESRILAIRDRLNIIKQTILRNDHFAPSTIPSRDREHLLTASLTSVLPHPHVILYKATHCIIYLFLVEIYKAALGPRWGALLALRYADTFKRGETLFGRSGRGRRARFLTAGEV